MAEHVSEYWDQEDRDALDRASTFDHRLDYFHKREQDVSYGETIEIEEHEVQ